MHCACTWKHTMFIGGCCALEVRAAQAYLTADCLPVNAPSSLLLRNKALAAATIQAAGVGRSVNALLEVHVMLTATPGAGEGHAVYQRLDGADSDHCALDTHHPACQKPCQLSSIVPLNDIRRHA